MLGVLLIGSCQFLSDLGSSRQKSFEPQKYIQKWYPNRLNFDLKSEQNQPKINQQSTKMVPGNGLERMFDKMEVEIVVHEPLAGPGVTLLR